MSAATPKSWVRLMGKRDHCSKHECRCGRTVNIPPLSFGCAKQKPTQMDPHNGLLANSCQKLQTRSPAGPHLQLAVHMPKASAEERNGAKPLSGKVTRDAQSSHQVHACFVPVARSTGEGLLRSKCWGTGQIAC